MSRVKGSGNKSTELKLIEIFRDNNVSGWRRNFPMQGKPDFVFPKKRLAIFVDGCFWHGGQKHCRIPKSNRKYWIAKIDRNRKRDRMVTKELRSKNITVVRVWEHELGNNTYKRKLRKIRQLLEQSK